MKTDDCKLDLLMIYLLHYFVPDYSSRQALVETDTYARLLQYIVGLDSQHEHGFNFNPV